ncbi:MAG: hypothetical protein IJH86_00110 [Clostridia bacterium]|nr:hypothetical protein [Clostridia bacterium]
MSAMKRMITAMLACMLLTALVSSAGAERCSVRVKGGGAVVYDASGEAVATLPQNTVLTLTGRKGKVCRISYKGKTGYMKKSDLAKVAAASAEASGNASGNAADFTPMNKTAYVASESAKVYNAKGKGVGKLSLNAQVTVTAVKDDICKISANGKTGYMKRCDLSAKPVKAAAASRAQGTREAAQATLKTAYVASESAKVYNAKGKGVGKLSRNAQVTVLAVKDDVCKISVGGKKGYMKKGDLSLKKANTSAASAQAEAAETSSRSAATPAKGTAREMDWWDSNIQKLFPRGATATVTDVDTGLAWREQRRGGTNHADVQPVTAKDTAAMKEAYGGTWSWARRAIFVTIDGNNYAASMNGMPHGGGSITDNDFNGHHCIHFTNSRTHGGNRVCALHQAAIKKAASTTLE